MFIENSICHDCVLYEEYPGKIQQNCKILTLAHIFAYNSKSMLPQRASFSHAGTHMSMLYNIPSTKNTTWISNSASQILVRITCIPYTAMYNGVVSYGAKIVNIPILAEQHMYSNKAALHNFKVANFASQLPGLDLQYPHTQSAARFPGPILVQDIVTFSPPFLHRLFFSSYEFPIAKNM